MSAGAPTTRTPPRGGRIDPHDDGAATALLRELVATPSVSGDERAAVELLVDRMRALGLDAHVDDAGNAVGVRGGAGGAASTRDVVLLGHIDTVPGDIPVRIEHNALHGRGAVDAKGPLCAFVVAAARAELPPGVRIVVIGAVGEESPDSPGAAFARARYSPAACLIGEPSAWDRVTIGYKGRLIADASFTRACAHSSGPEQTAPERAVAWWERVRAMAAALNAGREGVFDTLQCTLQHIDTASDGLRETTTAQVGFRLPTWIAPEDLAARVRAVAEMARAPSAEAQHAPAPDSLVFRGAAPAVRAERDNPVARAISGAIGDEGGSPRAVVKAGTSDMNTVAPRWRCPIAAYGPGDSALDHTPEERIDLSEYARSICVLRRAIESLAAELASAR